MSMFPLKRGSLDRKEILYFCITNGSMSDLLLTAWLVRLAADFRKFLHELVLNRLCLDSDSGDLLLHCTQTCSD